MSLISYSMYLLNASVLNIHFIEPGLNALGLEPGSPLFCVLGTVSFWGFTLLLTTLMYKYFELPVMALRTRLVPPRASGSVAQKPCAPAGCGRPVGVRFTPGAEQQAVAEPLYANGSLALVLAGDWLKKPLPN